MAPSIPEIKELESLIQKQLNKKLKILTNQSKMLTAPGENYGSIMLAVDLKIEDENQSEDELNLVAKLLPTNEMLLAVFQVQITFNKELAVYMEIVPELAKLEDEFNITEGRASDLFAVCYGGRKNLKTDNDLVDSDAVILFENLKKLGYENGDRLVGFDFETAEFILQNLARFHATPIALKHLKPDIYEKVIFKILSAKQDEGNKSIEENAEKYVDDIMNIINKNDSYTNKIENLSKLFKQKLLQNVFYKSINWKEPFATFSHSDFWMNNMMLLWDQSGQPSKLKIVDFQTPQNQSAVFDLLFFMFSSISPSALYDNIDKLIAIYYNSFINCLKEYQIDLDNYSWEKFTKEIKENTHDILCQILLMYKPILLERGEITDLDELKEEEFFDLSQISEDCKSRMSRTFAKFVEKDWI